MDYEKETEEEYNHYISGLGWFYLGIAILGAFFAAMLWVLA